MFHILMTTLLVTLQTLQKTYLYYKSFPSTYKLTQPLIPVP